MFLDFTQPLGMNALAFWAWEKNLKIGVTSGCYDLTHLYHLKYWERCKRHCDILVVGVDDDYLVKKCKGESRPIFNEGTRLAMVEQSRHVDAVILMHESEQFGDIVKKFRPDFIFKNGDFVESDTLKIFGKEFAKEVVYINDIEETTSTTAFIKKIKEST